MDDLFGDAVHHRPLEAVTAVRAHDDVGATLIRVVYDRVFRRSRPDRRHLGAGLGGAVGKPFGELLGFLADASSPQASSTGSRTSPNSPVSATETACTVPPWTAARSNPRSAAVSGVSLPSVGTTVSSFRRTVPGGWERSWVAERRPVHRQLRLDGVRQFAAGDGSRARDDVCDDRGPEVGPDYSRTTVANVSTAMAATVVNSRTSTADER